MAFEVSIAARGRILATLTKLKTYTTTITNNTTSLAIETRLGKLEELWSEFNTIEDKLRSYYEDDTKFESKSDTFQDKFFDVKAILLEHLRWRQPKPTDAKPQDTNSLDLLLNQQRSFFEGLADRTNLLDKSFTQLHDAPRLPRLSIEPFSGDVSTWPTFQDLFLSSVHNNITLTNIHKFQILRAHIKGDAAALISDISLTDTNYEEAWDKLTKRYNKKRPILKSLINTFLNQPNATSGTSQALRKLSDVSDQVLRGIKALGNEASKRDPWLIHILLQKTDSVTQELWSEKTLQNEFPCINEFLQFINDRCEAKENCITTKAHQPRHPTQVRAMYSTPTDEEGCPNCQRNHTLNKCFNFKRMSVDRRRSVVNDYKVCYNCLRKGHSSNTCSLSQSCKICQRRHHSMLHSSASPTSVPSSSEPAISAQQTSCNETISHSPQSSSHVPINQDINNLNNIDTVAMTTTYAQKSTTSQFGLLPTAIVHIRDRQGALHLARVLLDSGSQSTFIKESLIQRLNLQRSFANIKVTGLAGSQAATTKGRVSILIQSRYDQNESIQVEALILSKVTSTLPPVKVETHHWNNLHDLQLADPHFNSPGPIDILIGSDIFFRLLKRNQKLICGNMIAQSTIFGWIIAGTANPIPIQNTRGNIHEQKLLKSHTISIEEEVINKNLEAFWKLEEIPEYSTEKDDLCENHYLQNTTRDSTGRFVVSLPFKEPSPALGNSSSAAISRLHAMERKFSKDPILKQEYTNFMQEYIDLGHMQEIPKNDIICKEINCFYLPHHAVLKNDSSTTKLRVVFDGSAKSSTGISLNEKLLVGPTLQPDLVTLILQFRQHPIAFSADVEKMYRQVLINDKDKNFQRIVWRSNNTEPIRHYQLNTVTYGTSSAPFLAVRSLQQIAYEQRKLFPVAANKILSDFYIDDLLSGCDTEQNAIVIKKQLSEMLSCSGFNLRKWKSNSIQFINSIPAELTELDPLQIDDSECVKTLGLRWQPKNDTFIYKISIASDVNSKRELLSQVARIFDPLGWISPIIINFKILLQKLWLQKLNWDDELPKNIKREYNAISSTLKFASEIKIPRWLQVRDSDTNIQLHGFSDASEQAYAAVVYVRSIDIEGNTTTTIIASKSKVAPLKQISLPRLELCGAVLLAKLLKYIQSVMNNYSNVDVFAWTDSQIVLAWLSDVPRRWKCFVGNRTSQILDILPRASWSHVKSKENPADLASRGVSTQSLCSSKLWWEGPPWLRKEKSNWPSTTNIPETDCEKRKPSLHTHAQIIHYDVLLNLFERISSFKKIKHIIVKILKWRKTNKEMVEVDLLEKAETICIKWAQHQTFAKEFQELAAQNQLTKRSHSLISLTPFVDGNGVMRVGGRLTNINGSYNSMHPIILPNQHILSKRIIEETHNFYLHPGPTLLTSILRQTYWIVNCRNMVRSCVNKCIKCFRHKSIISKQLMGDLPTARVTQSRPFLHTGVDYAGPILIKARSGKGRIATSKAYICLFICFSTKAVHIELASDMTTDAFIAALRRFISRRGVPVEILSDNGTNFVGANRQLHELHTLHNSDIHKKLICDFLSQNKIKFTFNPAKAPHFGGLWESNIKSVKHHLNRVTGDSMMTFEEISTLLTQIEGILNSRPLCPLREDVNDLAALTPGHFLIGEALTTIPEPTLDDVPLNRLSRWQNIQARVQSFWKRWHLEYLHNLQQRQKWQTREPNLQINDLILIKEDNLPPTKWLLGRVIQLHPGSDNLTRVVTIKTMFGELKRPISKICRLPLEKIQENAKC